MDAPRIRFIANTDKVIEALTWLADAVPGIDVFHTCKVLFLADREHLRRYGRPILGDNYVAMDDGPVPSLAYDIAKHEGYRLDGETLRKADDALAYERTGRYPRLRALRAANTEVFSRTDLGCLREAAEKYGTMEFQELWNLVHQDEAYNRAWSGTGRNSEMNYELLLDPSDPFYEDQLRDLRETAPYLAL